EEGFGHCHLMLPRPALLSRNVTFYCHRASSAPAVSSSAPAAASFAIIPGTMKTSISQRLLSLGLIAVFLTSQLWATCGGGGGGGMGGMSGGMQQQVYMVPWKLINPE